MSRLVQSEAPPPTPLSRFVGRAEALLTVSRLFEAGNRLVTVWGPAGMGKTRLSIEHARACRAAGQTVLFIPLADLRDVGGAAAAVVRAMCTHPGNVTASELIKLAGRLLAAGGPLLLVLDNLEHLLPNVAQVIGDWLNTAPLARVLASSRERTRLAGEAAMELLPLTLPSEKKPKDLASSEAIQLFLARVSEQRSAELSLSEHAAPLAQLVCALEGIPLAIELAAARFDVLGLGGLLDRLGQRLDLLAKPKRNADGRTGTLRGAIEWSWGLLPDDERVALARCSVFEGSFSLDAATHVLSGMPSAALDLLEALRDKSMLRLLAPADPAEPARFALYEAVRQLAHEKLASMPGESAVATRLFGEYYLRLAEANCNTFAHSGDRAAVAAVAVELSQFDALIDSNPNSVQALRALAAIDFAVPAQGSFERHAARLEAALKEVDQSRLEPQLLARALGARGRSRMFRGVHNEAEQDLSRALSLATPGEHALLHAELLADLGVSAHRRGDLTRAVELYERALSVDRAAGASRTEGRVLGNLGAAHHDANRYEAAIGYYEQAISVLSLHFDHRLLGIAHTNLGILEQEQGATNAAKKRLDRALLLLKEAGDTRLYGIALTNLGLLHHEEGRLEEARFCHEQALAKLSVAGDRRSLGLAHVRLGAVLASLGQLDEGRVAFARGARAAGESDPPVLAATEAALALIDLALARRAQDERRFEAAQGHLSKAARRLDQARRGTGGEPSPAERSDDVRTLLRIAERGISALSGTGAQSVHNEHSPVSAARVREKTVGESETRSGAPERALLLSPGGNWLRCPGGTWQDLRKRGPARRLLIALVERQRESPGAGVSLNELQKAGWPGEQMAAASAANRIYVALHQLRSLGLSDKVIRTKDGYLLDPTLPVYNTTIEPV
ncbi:MAG: tetratricopeptide repeat protein [Polyangiaceae bacterium]|nr:tetratricopeptide repeat protein [Polyangiaceae bacterium]